MRKLNLNQQYIGRFAPSPSGPLHFGSLIAALGSYLQAKSQKGLWRLRIEDIDPPREVQGASVDILQTLQAYGLKWDDEVLYQSEQAPSYEKILAELRDEGLSYACHCTRKTIKSEGGIYLAHCRDKQLTIKNNALRLNLSKLKQTISQFYDHLQGTILLNPLQKDEDFIIKRKDGLYAYNLAVVIDDINQGITEVVRGADLLNTTGKQLCLYQLLKQLPPTYIHLPVATTAQGQKLSKQNHALAIDKNNPIPTLLKALNFLGHSMPEQADKSSCEKILQWAVKNWNLGNIPKQTEIEI